MWGFGLWWPKKFAKPSNNHPFITESLRKHLGSIGWRIRGLNSPFGGSSPSLSIIITHTLKPVTVRTSQSQQPPPDPRGLCNWPSMRCSNAIARLSSHPTPPPRQLRRRRGVPTTLAAASFSLAVSQRGPGGPRTQLAPRAEGGHGCVAPRSTQYRQEQAMHSTGPCTAWHTHGVPGTPGCVPVSLRWALAGVAGRAGAA